MTDKQYKKTLVILAHPNVDESTSHQFLIQTGHQLTEVDYHDISEIYGKQGYFSSSDEMRKLQDYDRIIFQFQLFWYQAPAILKVWLDQVFTFDGPLSERPILKEKELGLVVIAGSKALDYQRGGRHGVSMDELMSPYWAFASYWQMKALPYLAIHQFYDLDESAQWDLMLQYVTYLNAGSVGSFRDYQNQVISLARNVKDKTGNLLKETCPSYAALLMTLDDNCNHLSDLFKITHGGDMDDTLDR